MINAKHRYCFEDDTLLHYFIAHAPHALSPKNRGRSSVIQEKRGTPSAAARAAACISEMQYRIANVVRGGSGFYLLPLNTFKPAAVEHASRNA